MANNNTMAKIDMKAEVLQYIKDSVQLSEAEYDGLLETLAAPPMYTTVRINTMHANADTIRDRFAQVVRQQYTERGMVQAVNVESLQELPEMLFVRNLKMDVVPSGHEVIVGSQCGMSVLRGADVFVQGIVGAPHAMQAGDIVSVYADVKNTCLKGRVDTFEGEKLFVGNGVAQFSRAEIFQGDGKLSGVGIKMTAPVIVCPALNGVMEGEIFAQNLPSVLCGHVLGAEPGDVVLDACAAPGGKTTHAACSMNDAGVVVAIDKTPGKVEGLKKLVDMYKLKNVHIFHADSSKIANMEEHSGCFTDMGRLLPGPPFPCGSFSRILVDAPCSALGQRPACYNNISLPSVKSFSVLQRKILHQAYHLLRIGGTLVYSTCTITREENEHQVAWLLSTFKDLQLVPQTPHLGGIGLPTDGLSKEQLVLLQRFLPTGAGTPAGEHVTKDTIGFFCAKFVKNRQTQ